MQYSAPLLSALARAPGDDFPSDDDAGGAPDGLGAPHPTEAPSQRIALLVRDGVHRAQVEGLIKLLELRGHDTRVLAERLGSVLCSDGSRLPVDASLRRWRAWYFDSVVRLSGADAAGERLSAAEIAFLQPTTDGRSVPLTCLPWPAASPRAH